MIAVLLLRLDAGVVAVAVSLLEHAVGVLRDHGLFGRRGGGGAD